MNIIIFILFLFLLLILCNKNNINNINKGGETPGDTFNINDTIKILDTGNIGIIRKLYNKEGINLADVKLENNKTIIVVKQDNMELFNKYNIPLEKDFINFLKNSEWLNLNQLSDNANMVDVKSLIFNNIKTEEMINLYNEKNNNINDALNQNEILLQQNIIKADIMDKITEYKPYDIYLYNLYDLYKSLNNFKSGHLEDNICKSISNKYNNLCKEPIISEKQYNKYLKKKVEKDYEQTKHKLESLRKIKDTL